MRMTSNSCAYEKGGDAPETLVLAFSGGLDTSFCARWLAETRGARVVTVCVDTGGFGAEGLAWVADRAASLGVAEHHTVDARGAVWERFLAYVVKGQALRGGVYPVSVAAERTAQTEAVVSVARKVGAVGVAHGSTSAGNDQVRFDVALAALAPELEIIAPVRELGWSREESAAWLAERGVDVDTGTVSYSVNAGLVGTTIGGVETHDGWSLPPEEVYSLTVAPEAAPDVADELVITFEQGVAVAVDGERTDGPTLIDALNIRAGKHGVGRGIHVGDTILGVKGRIAFEAPGPVTLITAHRELAKLVLGKRQQHWLNQLGGFWGESLHEGLYHDPAMRDAEVFLDSVNRHVTGEVRVRLYRGTVTVLGARSSASLLAAQGAVYGEAAGAWSGADAAGFARIHGTAVRVAAERDRQLADDPKTIATSTSQNPLTDCVPS